MPINEATGEWFLKAAPKQLDVMRACREPDGMQKYIFVNGPKQSGKTAGCKLAVVDHAWNTNGARIAIIARSIGAGDDSGIWSELTKHNGTIEDYRSGNFGFDWIHWGAGKKKFGPRQKGASKKLYCEVTNKFGGVSHIELNSLKEERDVEENFFNRYFSMIYWCEAHQYENKNTFTTLLHSLRLDGVPDEQHILLLDGNPSSLGTDAWQYKTFFEFRTQADVTGDSRLLQKQLRLITITLDDNPFLSDERKSQIKESYKDDPDRYARYVEGRWVKSSSNSLFAGTFQPSVHVLGCEASGDQEAETMYPQEDCTELITGWDYGSANPAFVIAEKVMAQPYLGDEQSPNHAEKLLMELPDVSHFKFLDELYIAGFTGSVEDFVDMVLQKMHALERIIVTPIKWRHWSDKSAFDQRESIANSYIHKEVFAASDGEITLESAENKGRGSVGRGIRLWRKMLFQRRLFFSAIRTPILIEMNKNIHRQRETPDTVAVNDPMRHIFDAARYLIEKECCDELFDNIISVQRANSQAESGIISVRL